MFGPDVLQAIAIQVIPVLFAITIHEVAHGWVAGKLGDPTARMMGRITLNPVSHIDPVGTVLLPLFMAVVSQGAMVFGWAKPVPVNFANLRRLRLDSLLVAAAGPGSNLVQFLFWMLLLVIIGAVSGFPPDFFPTVGRLPGGLDLAGASAVERVTWPLAYIAQAGLRWNAALAALNLLPILPLDGGRILNSLLPRPLAEGYSRMEPFGFFILIAFLMFFGHFMVYLLLPLQYLLHVVF